MQFLLWHLGIFKNLQGFLSLKGSPVKSFKEKQIELSRVWWPVLHSLCLSNWKTPSFHWGLSVALLKGNIICSWRRKYFVLPGGHWLTARAIDGRGARVGLGASRREICCTKELLAPLKSLSSHLQSHGHAVSVLKLHSCGNCFTNFLWLSEVISEVLIKLHSSICIGMVMFLMLLCFLL